MLSKSFNWLSWFNWLNSQSSWQSVFFDVSVKPPRQNIVFLNFALPRQIGGESC